MAYFARFFFAQLVDKKKFKKKIKKKIGHLERFVFLFLSVKKLRFPALEVLSFASSFAGLSLEKKKSMDALKNEVALSESSSLSPAQKRFLDALRGTVGNVSEACLVTGTARATHYLWRKSPSYAEAVEEIEEACLDRAESALFRLIEEGNVPAVIFYLKTKGKKRGYHEKHEIDAWGSAPVNIVFTRHGSDAPLATDD